MKRQTYNEKDSGFVYILALVIPIAVALIISFVISGTAKDDSGNYIVSQQAWFNYLLQALSALIFVGIYFFYTKKNDISFKACGITKKPNYLMIIICVVVGFSLCFFTDKFISMIACGLKHIGIKVDSPFNIPLSTFGDYTLAILMIALLPALTEELIYRGIVLNGLRRMGKWPAILLSALAFCLMHGNIAQFSYTFLLGIVLGYIMFETSNLVLCVIIHFMNNATVLTQMYITQSSGTIPDSISLTYALEAVGFLILAVGIAILAFYLIHLIKKKQTAKEEKVEEVKEEKTVDEKTKQKTKNLISQSIKFVRPEKQEEVKEEPFSKKNLVMLIVGYAIAVCLTILHLF